MIWVLLSPGVLAIQTAIYYRIEAQNICTTLVFYIGLVRCIGKIWIEKDEQVGSFFIVFVNESI